MRIKGDDSNLAAPRYFLFVIEATPRDGTAAKLIQICTVLTRDKGRERESIRVITRRKMFGVNHYRLPTLLWNILFFFLFFFLQAIKRGDVQGDKNLVVEMISKSRTLFISFIFVF